MDGTSEPPSPPAAAPPPLPPPPWQPPQRAAPPWRPPSRHDDGYVAASIGGAVGCVGLGVLAGVVALLGVSWASAPHFELGQGAMFLMLVAAGLAAVVGLGLGTALGLLIGGHPYAASTAAIAVGLAVVLVLLPVIGWAGWFAAPAAARLIRLRASARAPRG